MWWWPKSQSRWNALHQPCAAALTHPGANTQHSPRFSLLLVRGSSPETQWKCSCASGSAHPSWPSAAQCSPPPAACAGPGGTGHHVSTAQLPLTAHPYARSNSATPGLLQAVEPAPCHGQEGNNKASLSTLPKDAARSDSPEPLTQSLYPTPTTSQQLHTISLKLWKHP